MSEVNWDSVKRHDRILAADNARMVERRLEVEQAHQRLVDAALAFLEHFNPNDMAEDKAQQFWVLFDAATVSKLATQRPAHA